MALRSYSLDPPLRKQKIMGSPFSYASDTSRIPSFLLCFGGLAQNRSKIEIGCTQRKRSAMEACSTPAAYKGKSMNIFAFGAPASLRSQAKNYSFM